MLFKATCFFTTLFCLAFFGRSSSPFSTFVVNGSVSRVHTEGQEGVDRATEGGWAIPRTLGSLSGCKRCIVSLLHSFLILRSACVANLQKLSLSDPLAPSCSRLSPKFSFPSASTSLSCRESFFSYFDAPPSRSAGTILVSLWERRIYDKRCLESTLKYLHLDHR